MKCVFCRTGETQPGATDVTLRKGEKVMILEGVPAEICQNCGEAFFPAEVAQRLEIYESELPKKGEKVRVTPFHVA